MLASGPAVISVIVPLRNEQSCVAERFRPFADREDCEPSWPKTADPPTRSERLTRSARAAFPQPGTRGLRLARAAREAGEQSSSSSTPIPAA